MSEDPRVEAIAVSMCELKHGEETAYMLVRSWESAPVDAYDDGEVACHYVWRQFEHRAQSALAAADAAAWRPIEEAPRDKTWIDLWHEVFGRIVNARWKDVEWRTENVNDGGLLDYGKIDHQSRITHFRYRPDPPQEKE